jgi:chromosome segregation ATPase
MTNESSEQAEAVARRILAEEGKLTVRRLAAVVGGDTGRLSRIVSQIKGEAAQQETAGAASGVDLAGLPDALPATVRRSLQALGHVMVREIGRVAGEAAAVARAQEEALRGEHEQALTAAQGELADVQAQLGEVEEMASVTQRELEQVRADVGDRTQRIATLESARDTEAVARAREAERYETRLREMEADARKQAETRSAAEVACASAEAELRTVREILEGERKARQTTEERLADERSARILVGEQLQEAQERIRLLEERLEGEREGRRALEEIIRGQLTAATSPKRSAAGKTAGA